MKMTESFKYWFPTELNTKKVHRQWETGVSRSLYLDIPSKILQIHYWTYIVKSPHFPHLPVNYKVTWLIKLTWPAPLVQNIGESYKQVLIKIAWSMLNQWILTLPMMHFSMAAIELLDSGTTIFIIIPRPYPTLYPTLCPTSILLQTPWNFTPALQCQRRKEVFYLMIAHTMKFVIPVVCAILSVGRTLAANKKE